MNRRSQALRPMARALVGVLTIAVLGVTSVRAQDAPADDEGARALADFGRLVLGRWEAEGSRHDFTWGVGERVIKSTSYTAVDGAWVTVSEGWWYWDPTDRTIRGQTVAVDMGIDLFEYRSRIDGNEVVHDLVSHGEFGGVYVERWSFEDDGYSWSLEQQGQRVMGGAYRRAR